MDTAIFESFEKGCIEKLPGEINAILQQADGKKPCAIGFITTDDLYGFYLSWEYTDNIREYFQWRNGAYPDFLYQPIVDIVDSSDIDFCNPSDEKWDFVKALLSTLERVIKGLPDDVFSKNGFSSEDVLFFATMSDGDYITQMLDESVNMFNSQG